MGLRASVMQNQFQVLQEGIGDNIVSSEKYPVSGKPSRRKRRNKGDLATHSLTIRTQQHAPPPGSPFKESISATSSPVHHHRLSDRNIPQHSPKWITRNASGDVVTNTPRQQLDDAVGTSSRRITTQLSSDAVLNGHKRTQGTASHRPPSYTGHLTRQLRRRVSNRSGQHNASASSAGQRAAELLAVCCR